MKGGDREKGTDRGTEIVVSHLEDHIVIKQLKNEKSHQLSAQLMKTKSLMALKQKVVMKDRLIHAHQIELKELIDISQKFMKKILKILLKCKALLVTEIHRKKRTQSVKVLDLNLLAERISPRKMICELNFWIKGIESS
jgi:hypothetical protein